MKVNGQPCRTIRPAADGRAVEIIDQTKLPHALVTVRLENLQDAERAIRDMQVRGAPLIGVTAAYGIALALRHSASDAAIENACSVLLATRPTAVNLFWGLARMREFVLARVAKLSVEASSPVGLRLMRGDAANQAELTLLALRWGLIER